MPAQKAPAETEAAQTATEPTEPSKTPPSKTPVVGLVASAGGLDALTRFFAATPAKSGMAFVLVPHLAPAFPSRMSELIGRQTPVPIVEATEGTVVEADHGYVIPPNKQMTIVDGALRLTDLDAQSEIQTSIDLFLESLATDRQEQAICVVLSGSGAHGSQGLKAVKAAGGLAVVQTPATAEHPSMAENAIATGLADLILPPEEMPAALIKHLQAGSLLDGEDAESDELDQILALLRIHTHIDFRVYRKRMVNRRVGRRMSLCHVDRLSDYLRCIRERPEELQQLAKDLLISVTTFFRDPDAWRTLETEVIVPLVRAKAIDQPIRVWIAGCASGEEAYTLGMLLLEQVSAAQKNCPVQIFATDVDEAALAAARRAVYPESIRSDVSPERLSRFFTRLESSSYQVKKQLRDAVTFARQNILSDAPFSRLDLVICRNQLIYLEQEVQKRIIELMHFALHHGGALFLGSAETIGRRADLFEAISAKWRIYRCIGSAAVQKLRFPVTPVEPGLAAATGQAKGPQQPQRLAELAQSVLLRKLRVAWVVINRNYEVLHFAGPTEDVLIQPSGPPTHDLLSLARPGLDSKLRVAVQRAIRENAPQAIQGVAVRRAGARRRFDIDVEPLAGSRQTEGLLLVSFHELPESPDSPSSEEEQRTPATDDDLLRQLEQELEMTRVDLQNSIEELGEANEELRASNEEVISMNEELQSANEELETSKEELQSLNEELNTVNNQLQEKVQELEAASNDMANLFDSTDIATVFLDAQFQIKRFTPAAKKFFKLVSADIGRSITDILKTFEDARLVEDAEGVLRDFKTRDAEVRSEDGLWWARRMTPYRTTDERVAGVVITFVDVTEHKYARDAVVQRLAAIVEDSADAIYSEDLQGTIRTWNRGAQHLYGHSEEEAVGRSIKIVIPDNRIDEWQQWMSRVAQGEHLAQLEAERVRKGGERIFVAMTYSPLHNPQGAIVGVSVTARDITDRKRLAEELHASRDRLNADNAALRKLQEVSSRLVQAGDTTTILQDILDAALAVTAADMGAVQMLDGDSGPLRIVASRGFEAPFLSSLNALPDAPGSYYGEILRGERVVLDNVATSDLVAGASREALQAAGIFALQSTPLIDRSGRLLGALSTHYRRPTRPSERELRLVDLLARQAADWFERVRAERSLRESQEYIEAVLNTAADAIITIDHDGIITTANRAAERFFGYAVQDLIGQNVRMLMPAPHFDLHDQYIARYLQTGEARAVGMPSRKVMCKRKDGSVFPAGIVVSEVRRLQVFTAIIRDATEEEQLQRHVLEIASDEQRRIGQELHDATGQELTGLSLISGALLENVERAAPAAEGGRVLSEADYQQLQQTAHRLVHAIKDAHRHVQELSRGILPVQIDSEGLRSALEELARAANSGSLTCTFECPGPVAIRDNTTATHLYRIAQEALNNAVRHGQARRIEISLIEEPDQVVLAVHDDGRGFDPEAAPPEGVGSGMGLRIMHYRASLIGGALHIEHAAQGGMVVSCAISRSGNLS